MNCHEFRETYNENAVILTHRGLYTQNDFFNCAIIRLAFTEAYGRGTGIYTWNDLNSPPEDVRPGCSTVEEGYIITQSNPSVEDVLETWNTYSPILFRRDHTEVALASTERLEALMYSLMDLHMADIFPMFNQTWSESNDIIKTGGDIKMVFQYRKKIMTDGVNVASMIISRLIEQQRDFYRVGVRIDDAISKAYTDERLKLDDHNVIAIIEEPYHFYDIGNVVRRHTTGPDRIAIWIQTNQKNGVVAGYYAKGISHFLTIPFHIGKDEYLEGFPAIRKSANDTSGDAVFSQDLDMLIDYCHKAYERWVSDLDPFIDADDGRWWVNEPDTEVTYTDEDVEEAVKELFYVKKLKDPLKNMLVDLAKKFMYLVKKHLNAANS